MPPGVLSRVSEVGLPDALRSYVDNAICRYLCGYEKHARCPHAQITARIFSPDRWSKDTDKLPHEQPSERGVRKGAHFIYLVRKCRELPDCNPHLNGCTVLRNLPIYGSEALPGELNSPWDKFVLEMRPLRRHLQHVKKVQHHPEQLDTEWLRQLLRSGGPAVMLLQPLQSCAPLLPAPAREMILQATQTWSSTNHHLFPDAARAHAWQLLRLGHLLSRSPQFAGEAAALVDVWLTYVMPHAMSRDAGISQSTKEEGREAGYSFFV